MATPQNPEQPFPIEVQHDRRRRQFCVRLNDFRIDPKANGLRGPAFVEMETEPLLTADSPIYFRQGWEETGSEANIPTSRSENLKTKKKHLGCHDRAVLLYEYVGKRTVDLQHTEVPDAFRGRGIAKHLAKAAMDFVVEEDLKAHLTCWYIQKFVKENPLPQYLDHLQS